MNLFELFVKIGVDDQASGKLSKLSKNLGKGLATAAKIGTAAVGAAAAGITALTKAAVDNYAEYEQLVGGVETLFKDNANTVMQYAQNAYKTAGLSANEYMSAVTSFSASLLQSLGGDTEAAAEYANQALTDMSDNANKMGTSMEMIQNAYQGFAKQNYTMLDNLKLGYGGTKTEMERLIKDAAKLDKSIDANSLSFENIVKAINVVQTEMGITGTTAEEAASTISGSVASMKSAWENLVTGLGDSNADINVLLDNFIDSVATTGKNLIPTIKTIISKLLLAIEQRGPDLLAEGVVLIGKLAVGLVKAIPNLIAKIPEIIKSIVNAFRSRSGEFSSIGKNIIDGIKSGISNAWRNLKTWFKNLFVDLIGIAKKILGIKSPSRVFRDQIGKQMAAGLGLGWEDEFGKVKSDIEDSLDFDDASVGINASIRKIGAGAAGGAFGGTSIGNITINIDGAKYSDEQSLAQAVAEAIQSMTDRRTAVYA